MKIILSLSALFFVIFSGNGQEENWLSFPVKRIDSTRQDTTKQVTLDYSAQDGEVNIHKDERIEGLKKFVRSGEESIEGVLIDGYRVMIYFDQDKTKSEQQKATFMSMYNEHSAYVDYVAPNYRVRVGNFRTKLEAEKLKQELIAMFPTAIVVADKIHLPVIESPESTSGN